MGAALSADRWRPERAVSSSAAAFQKTTRSSVSTAMTASGRPARNETSVEPGLEKIFVIPRRRRTSNAASRTVTGVEVLAEAPSGRTWVPLTLRGSLSRRPQHPCVRCW